MPNEQLTLDATPEDQPKKKGRPTKVTPNPDRPASLVAIPVDPPVSDSSAIMRLIERVSLDPAFDVAKLEQLLAVREKWEASEARKAFVAAKAAFKAEAPAIGKNKHVGFKSKTGGASTDYWHSTLDHIAGLLMPVLSKHGLTHSWQTEQIEGGLIRVTCILEHVLGHSERVVLQASPDTSGNKNSIQAVGSTVTYLSRYTLLSILGMATGEQDDDGAGADGEPDVITEEQKDELIQMIVDTGTDTAKFCVFMGVGAVDEILAKDFNKAKTALAAKKAEKK